ncbi:unnamed protein product, partial [marine sediment metagenome]
TRPGGLYKGVGGVNMPLTTEDIERIAKKNR